MKRRVTDRAILRRLKRSGLDVEALRVALGQRPAYVAVAVDRYELDEGGCRHVLREVRIITSEPAK